ncbi:MAG: Spy/CpxP family protein refolding chaperone [Thermodesulfobacteriota bacterium]|nr:Spy/CpxP family protein refolding chaperone [Thermodesulfobacteriota bacterium]
MKSKKMIGLVIAGIVVIAGTLILTGTLLATGEKFSKCRSGFGMHQGMMGMNMFKDLNLSDTQKEQVQGIITKYRDQRENTADELRQTMRETMCNAIFAEKFNEEKVREAFRESSKAREDMVVQKAKMISEIKTILDPEQVELLKERKTQMMEKGRGCGGFRQMMFKSCFRNSHE